MDTLNTIFSRKSVRSYTGERVSDADLKTIIKAANASPVGMKRYETMHLTVIDNQELLKQIDEITAQMFGKPEINPLYGAPTLVIVSVKPEGEEVGNVGFSNAAIMVHNMVMAATELDIGNCYIWGALRAINAKPDLVSSLAIPNGFVPCCGITLGITQEKFEMRDVPNDRVTINYLK